MKRLPLWPSAASRWLVCSGQPRVSAIAQTLPREESPYAEEGKLAHSYLEWVLDGGVGDAPKIPDDQRKLIDEVAEDIGLYAEVGGYVLYAETRYKLSFDTGASDHPAHEMNLIVDVALVNDDSIVILDYKHGEGMPVGAGNNPQLLLYLAAVMAKYPGRTYLTVGIIQPRGLGEGWTSTRVEKYEIDGFLEDVKAAVWRAYAGEVEYVQGPHCQFCPGTKNPVCPAQLSGAIDALACRDFDSGQTQSWWLLDRLDGLKKIIKGVDTAADVWLKSGKKINGYRMMEKKGRRSWYAPEEVPAVLANLLEGDEEEYKTTKTTPITLTEACKIAKRKKVNIDGLIHQPTTLKRVKTDTNEDYEIENDVKMDAIDG